MRLVVALAFFTGCFDPQYGEGTLHCAAGGECPSGYACYDSLCYSHEPITTTDAGRDVQSRADNSTEAAPTLARQLDEPCDVLNARTTSRSDNCAGGLICVEGNAGATCMTLCRSNAECGAALCEQRRLDPVAATTALVCGRPSVACDPTQPSTSCSPNRVCYLDHDRTICETQSGDNTNGSCLYARDCLPGFTCAEGLGRCLPTCAPDGVCGIGQTCRVGTLWGYCF